MKWILILCAGLVVQGNLKAQLTNLDRKTLAVKEDSLKFYSEGIITNINPADRLKSDSLFTKAFVRSLKMPFSFDYRFDSLQSISRLYSPDSTFRIFTWQMVVNENVVRQHGAIQMKTKDGALKLFPLIDKSDVTRNIGDTVVNNYNWIGAVYYKIVMNKYLNLASYTLLGYDENNIRSNRKIIEVLNFKDGLPVFGGNYFNVPDTNKTGRTLARYVLEYKRGAGPRLTYDEDLNMIIMEHLISESNEPKKKFTLIPDGDYEGFKWQNGKWNYITKVFNLVTPENAPPTPSLIRDANGNIDETKLAGYEAPESVTPKKSRKPRKE